MASRSARSMSCLLIVVLQSVVGGVRLERWESVIQLPTQVDEEVGTRWAVLLAGSKGYKNYRHQADVCHAYQLLIKGGLKEENIVVFMYDDIANDDYNPMPGVIINHPQGPDVYAGVPKDYTGENVTTENLYAVILGDKSKVKGGSGKVINSQPNDTIFIYYSGHGGPGVLTMPNPPRVFADDFNQVLKEKHASGGYKKMVVYVEACESGSIFEGLMPTDINVYVTTASNALENSYATYCPSIDPPSLLEYNTCVGDLYSVAWMEDSDTHDRKTETVEQQYEAVKNRTLNWENSRYGSHVMEYGDRSIKGESLYTFQGFNTDTLHVLPHNTTQTKIVEQRDAEIYIMWQLYKRSEDETEKREILKQLTKTVKHRNHIDGSVVLIGTILFGPAKGSSVLKSVRDPGMVMVDDWDCLKSTVRVFETHCGSLSEYGLKHMRAFANICNSGVSEASIEEACVEACAAYTADEWHPSNRGYSA